jgi:galactofuranose transport system permease protein
VVPAGSDRQSATGNVINQIGSLDSACQQVVSGAFLAVVVIAQTWLGRRRRML